MRKIIMFLLVISTGIYGQTEIEIPEIIPPSPNAYNILKYGDYPVSHHSGIPDITIPLYNINLSDITLPITLTYNASGIKVNEEAGRTGLGWSLNTGGLISRTISGDDDFIPNKTSGYFTVGSPFKDYKLYENIIDYPVIHGCQYYWKQSADDLLESIYNNEMYDYSPDKFNYNFNGYSGAFSVLHDKSMLKEREEDNIILKYEYINNNLLVWKATISDGTIYTFAQPERYLTHSEKFPKGGGINTWYITKIETLNGNVINFNYDINTVAYYDISKTSQSYTPEKGIVDDYSSEFLQQYDIIKLKSISFPNGYLTFEYEEGRVDQPYEPVLKTIKIRNNELVNTFSKDIVFNYNYFVANNTGKEIQSISQIKYILGGLPDAYMRLVNDDWNKKRLKLESLDFVSNGKKESYKFTYNESNLPPKLSTGRDHWGYFNSQNNQHLIPNQIYRNPLRKDFSIEGGLSYFPADREVYATYNQAFILTDVVYPTGGKTKFEYETNRYNSSIFEGDPLRKNYLYKEKEIYYIGSRIGNGSPAILNQSVIENSFSISESTQGTLDINIILPTNVGTFINQLSTNPKEDLVITIKNETNGEIIESLELSRYINSFLSFPNNNDPNLLKTLFYKSKKTLPVGNYKVTIKGTAKSSFNEFSFKYKYITGVNDYINSHPISYAGGLRIKKISSFLDDKIVAIKQFVYDDTQSKLITSYPRYHYMNFRGPDRSYFISSSGLRSNKTPVGYGQVSIYEGISDREYGKAVYKYHIKPDNNLDYSWRPKNYQTLSANAYMPFDYTPVGAPSLSISYAENGRISEELYYNKDNSLVKQVIYDYSVLNSPILWGIRTAYSGPDNLPTFDKNTVCLNYTTNMSPMSAYLHPVIHPQWNILNKKTENQIASNGLIQTITNYEYNSSNKQVQKQMSYNSDTKKQTIEYVYSISVNTEMGGRLRTLNKVNEVMEVKKDNNGVLEHIINEYKVFNNIPRKSIIKSNTTSNRVLEPRIQFHNYDKYGNPIYLSKDDSNHTFYLWSYSGQYPIAEIKNATFTEVETAAKTIFSVASIDALSALSIPSETKLKDGSLQRVLPKALVTTYTYKPLVGMLTSTDPSGITTYYDYDSFGRLKETYIYKDNIVSTANKQIIQSYDYHYQNQ